MEGNRSQEESRDSPHLGKYVCSYSYITTCYTCTYVGCSRHVMVQTTLNAGDRADHSVSTSHAIRTAAAN